MTRAEFIIEEVKKLWGVSLNKEFFVRDVFSFSGCDGIDCPPYVDPHDIGLCNKCPYRNFWDEEVQK